ncbi:MAG: hypothetical protein ACOX37_12205 [Bacillota bacterium]
MMGLVEEIGGPPVPGIGFGLGLERILLLLKKLDSLPSLRPGPMAFSWPPPGGMFAVLLFNCSINCAKKG